MAQQKPHDVNEPSRRRLLKGIGALGGALAITGGCPVAHAAKAESSPGTLTPDARQEKQPFYGRHQAGILTPQQASMMLVAFDVLAADKADLERLFRLLTQRIAFLTQGGPAPDTPNPRLPPMDSGILGPWIAPDNLTITVSVGHSLFDERFGLADKAPKKLQPMTRFPNDSLDAALCHGDLLLQICANTQDTVIHALRDVIKHTPDLLSVRWKREGFISDSAARSKGKETPINLLGFKDGTANPAALRRHGNAAGHDLVDGLAQQFLPVPQNGAALCLYKAGNGAHQGGLACAVGTDQGNDLAVRHVQRHTAQGLNAAIGNM